MNVYDFDKTVYKGDSTLDFYLYALKKKPSVIRCLPRQVWGTVLYMLKRIDKTALKEYFFCFLACIDAEKLAENFWMQNEHKIYGWYLRKKRKDDVIISASPYFLLKPICRTLGIKWLIASRVDMRTGRFTGKNCRGEEKLRRLLECFEDISIECFYSDSLSDLPLACIADKAFLIKKGKVTPWK